jgi:hypothetical protein
LTSWQVMIIVTNTTSLLSSPAPHATPPAPPWQEASITVEYVIGCLMSRHALADLQKVNPFLPAEAVHQALHLAAAALAYANRLGQVRGALPCPLPLPSGAVRAC